MRMFRDRQAAAEELAEHLTYLKPEKPIVLGLAYGGVPIAEHIAAALEAPMDVLIIEKLAAPDNPSLIVGAVDENGRISLIERTARWHHVDTQQLVEPARERFRQIQKLQARLRTLLPAVDVNGRTVVIVSDGVATGARMLGAIASVRDRGAAKIIVAAPAGSGDATWQLHRLADAVVIPHRPAKFKGISHFYEHFTDITDEHMLAIVSRWIESQPDPHTGVKTILMKLRNTRGQVLCTEIDLPPMVRRETGPYPAVIFAHGFESSGKSARSVAISGRLAKRGIIGVRLSFTGHGTSEGDIDDATDQQMLDDVTVVARAVANLTEVDPNRIGLVGSGRGAMIALHFAARQPDIRAMVLRGPIIEGDLDDVKDIRTPTLLIHAERDTALEEWIESMNRDLPVEHELLRIPNSNRLFNDPISMELMVNTTVDWLVDHLDGSPEDILRQEVPIVETVERYETVREPASGE